MKAKPYFVCFVIFVFLSFGVAFAENFSYPPTLHISSQDSSCTTEYKKPVIHGDGAAFRIQYFDPEYVNPVTGNIGETIDFYPYDPIMEGNRKYFWTNDTVTDSQDFSYSGNEMTVDLSATSGIFEAKSRIRSRSAGSDAFMYALTSVGHFFVVNGPTPGEPIQLVTDILFQGRVFANRNGGTEQNANASFSINLGVVASPANTTPTQVNPIYINGAASDGPWGGNTCETIPNFLFPADSQPHDVNVIIRSRPFTVLTGVEYRMNLNINASAGANGVTGAESYVDFLDPKMVTSLDFATVMDGDGSPAALSPSGFFLDNGSPELVPLGPGSPSGYTVTLLRIPVDIDIKPLSKRNVVKYKGRGIIPVTILSTKEFNAVRQIDQNSLTFGVTGDEQSRAFCTSFKLFHEYFVCGFFIEEAGFKCGDTEGILKGKTKSGTRIEGKDRVKIINCK